MKPKVNRIYFTDSELDYIIKRLTSMYWLATLLVLAMSVVVGFELSEWIAEHQEFLNGLFQ